jgi:hypothetical protein
MLTAMKDPVALGSGPANNDGPGHPTFAWVSGSARGMQAKRGKTTDCGGLAPLTVAQRREMRAEYAAPGRDGRVLALLDQLRRAEERIAQQARDLENQEARLSRRRIESCGVENDAAARR